MYISKTMKEDDCSVQIFIIIQVYSLYLCISLGLNPTCQTFLCQEICTVLTFLKRSLDMASDIGHLFGRSTVYTTATD